MASARSLRIYAKESLIPFMKSEGFELVKGLSFVKPAPDNMVYFIDCFASRWGNVRFDVGVYVSELDEGRSEDCSWPRAMASLVGGELTKDEPMLKYQGEIWNFEKDPEQLITIVESSIKQFALPFFQGITNRKEMVEAIDNDWYKWQRDEDLLNQILQNSLNK